MVQELHPAGSASTETGNSSCVGSKIDASN